MATVGGALEQQRKNNVISFDNVETEIYLRSSWTRQKWIDEGEGDTRLHKLVNSMNYWKQKLAKAMGNTNVILTLFNEERDVRLDLLTVIEAIEALSENILVTGFTEFRNPRYISIQLQSEEAKKFVEENFKNLGSDTVVFLKWAQKSHVHSIRAHWIPPHIKIDKVRAEILKYFDIIEEKREDRVFMSGRNFESGMIAFKGYLKKNEKVENVPHIAIIEGLECLITIYGRDSLCLTCGELGHRSFECPTPFCNRCKSLHSKFTDCGTSIDGINTYAQKVKVHRNSKFSEASMEGTDCIPLILDSNNISGQAQNNVNTTDITENESKSFQKSTTVLRKLLSGCNDTHQVKSLTNNKEDEKGNFSDEVIPGVLQCNSKEEEFSSEKSMKIVDDYFKELQALKVPKVNRSSAEFPNDDVDQLQSTNQFDLMDSEVSNLKRKLTEDSVKIKVRNRTRGPIKTYGRGGTIPKARHKNNLFDVLAEDEDDTE